VILLNGSSYTYDPQENRIIPKVVGTYHQIPLIPAWAVTIHKAQGKTLRSVLLDLGKGAFAAGQAYVALSRCRSLEDITLKRPISRRDVICDERVKRFYEALRRVEQA